jgi:hypothetical protein
MTKPKKTTLQSAPTILPIFFENDLKVTIHHLVDEERSPALEALSPKVVEYSISGTALTLRHKINDAVVPELRSLQRGHSRIKVYLAHGTYTRELTAVYTNSKCDRASMSNATPLLFTLSAVIEIDRYV